MYKVLFISTLWFFLTNNLIAQETQNQVLNSNRIGFTESSRAVMKGAFLLEGGLGIGHSKYNYSHGSFTRNFIRTPKLRLSYGLNSFMEVQAEGNYFKHQAFSNTGYRYSMKGSKYSLGIKFNLSKQKGMLPQTAFSITEKYYYGNAFTPYFKTTANLAWSYKLGEHFDLSGNILYSHSEGYYNGLGLGIRLGYHFNDNFGLFTEWYLFDDYTDFSIINLGAWYKVSPRFLLSLNVGTNKITKSDWDYSNSSINATLGVSFLLFNPEKKYKKMKRR